MFVNGDLEGKFIMDRNLGARDTKFAADGTGIMYYQYGRKDLFPGYNETGSTKTRAYSERSEEMWEINGIEAATSILISVNNPLDFYKIPSGNWTNDVDSESYVWNDFEQDLSDNGKSIFDPSPKGWKVPINGTWEHFDTKMSDWVYVADSDQPGRNYQLADEKNAYYPATGYRNSSDIGGFSTRIYYWSSTPSSATYSYRLFTNLSAIYPSYTNARSSAFPVRPVQHYE